MKSATLFKPKPGYRYLVKVKYIDEIYEVVIYGMNPAGKQSRELEFRDLDGCVRE